MSKDFDDYLRPMTADRLNELAGALAREEAIRRVMAGSGESREIVTEMLDAAESREAQAVLTPDPLPKVGPHLDSDGEPCPCTQADGS